MLPWGLPEQLLRAVRPVQIRMDLAPRAKIGMEVVESGWPPAIASVSADPGPLTCIRETRTNQEGSRIRAADSSRVVSSSVGWVNHVLSSINGRATAIFLFYVFGSF